MKHSLPSVLLQLTIILNLLFGASTQAFSQEEPIKFGKVDMKELQMSKYDKDTSASAVVLCDYGNSYFKYSDSDGFQVYFEHHIRIKILRKSGYEWADASIPLYIVNSSNDEELLYLKGYTYNVVDGKIVKDKLTKEVVFDEKVTDRWMVKKFTMPNVREGSVIEYSYSIKSDFAFNFREWEFQKTIPVVWSEYRARIPEYFRYKQIAQGYEPFFINERNNTTEIFTVRLEGQNIPTSGFSSSSGRIPTKFEQVKAEAVSYRWVTKDVVAFKEEPYMTAVQDYITKIEFELSSTKYPGQIEKSYTNTWESITRELLESENFGSQLTKAAFVKNEIAAINSKFSDPEQRMFGIYEFVRKSMKWNGSKRLYTESPLKKAYEHHTGSSADINLLLVVMLKEAGLNANPVALSTREHGKIIESYPLIKKFNYVIAHVSLNGNDYLLDATEPLINYGMLPTRCLNGQGRIISKEAPRWIPLQTIEKSTQLFSARMNITPTGDIKGLVDVSHGGYSGLAIRRNIQAEGKDKYVERMKKENPAWQVEKYDFTDIEDISKAITAKYELSIEDQVQVAGSLIYLKPMLTEGKKENPFKLENRQFPVDFSVPLDETYVCSFTFPEGYEVETLPKGAMLDLPEKAGRFSYLVAVNGNTIQISSRISLKKPIFLSHEYNYLKEFFNQIVSKHAEQIVLKKKS